jgi:hypothetical protein
MEDSFVDGHKESETYILLITTLNYIIQQDAKT